MNVVVHSWVLCRVNETSFLRLSQLCSRSWVPAAHSCVHNLFLLQTASSVYSDVIARERAPKSQKARAHAAAHVKPLAVGFAVFSAHILLLYLVT